MENQNYTDITYLVEKAQKNEKIKRLLDNSLKWTSLLANLITLFLLFAFYLNQNSFNQKVSKNLLSQRTRVLSAAVQVLPMRLIIPRLNVSADIRSVGVTPEGTMEVPGNTVDVGWFKLGPQPGERGSSVISGHMDGENGEAGVFANLYKLKEGDKVYIEDDKGASTAFVVRESRTYNPGFADEVFSPADKAHLNLITCDGVWDGAKKSYSKRLVVFADIAH